ncbi:hypothetical protein [Niabella beijingensis]|uniref:hypothetical protein n=1 Tax=Niabella beijingensis TaxID=2872700 RepID=UPI001CBB19EC|nr:hypothetical protein [Niabella beijingensis]MBZ4189672.1 hypothetical protein [Niabella beijingensis]
MKHYFSVFWIIVFLGACGSNETGTAKAPPVKDTAAVAAGPAPVVEDTTVLVAVIRAEFERINKMPLTSKQFNWQSSEKCQPPYQEGTATYYYDKGTLVKIHNQGAEDHGEWKEDYYFRKGQLIFIYLDNAYGGAANPTAYKYQNRYYFNNNHLIKKLESTNPEYHLEQDRIADMIRIAGRLYGAADSNTISKILTCE